MMALSVTIMPNVLGYIGESFPFWAPTRLYKQPLNRPNIVQIVAPITQSSYRELDFLVSKIGLIPKIIVFVNKIDDAVKIAVYHRLLLLPEDQD